MERKYREASHLFRRAGFGGTHDEIVEHQNKSWGALVDMVLDQTRAPALGQNPNLAKSRGWQEKYVDMLSYWLDRATRPVDQAPIVEKMVLFWHGHLCSGLQKVNNHQAMFDQNQLFRTQGMGDFRQLLWNVSTGTAMLRYLDNDRNTAYELNENFSRELMELFVVGPGHYNEGDVRAAARAWSGHGLDKERNHYEFHPEHHDGGPKTFLGQRGNWNASDIINLLLNNRRNAHAKFLSAKLWSFFAYPVAVNDPVVADIAAVYRRSLDISQTLRAIFMHPKFRSEQAMQGLLRSPIEYAVAVMRHTRTDCSQARPEWYLRTMGQEAFDPPNVSGWRSNEYWISESAAWAKGSYANHVRWRVFERDDLTDVSEVTSWNPKTFKVTPQQAVDMALRNYNMRLESSQTRKALLDYVATERSGENSWGQRAGLLYLPLMSPEMQMA